MTELRRVAWNHVRGREVIRVSWTAGALSFMAGGLVVERPHRLSPASTLNLKLSPYNVGLRVTDSDGATLDLNQTGIHWDGWLSVPASAVFEAVRSVPDKKEPSS